MQNFLKTFSVSLVLTIILSSCESTIYFDSPQPRKYKNQDSFFKKIKGTFLNLEDSTLLTISDNKIESAQYVTFPLKIEDVNLEKIGKKKIKAGINAAWSADTVYKDWSSEKILFEISEKQILRYYQEHYFLNFEKGETKWNVKLIGFDDEGYLLFKSFTEKDIDWNGKIKDASLESFIDNPFDLLIGYFNNKNLYLEYCALKSKATFKIGFAKVNDKIYDLVVSQDPKNIDSFIEIIRKYLELLQKI